jgi:type I restriction enzyme S subunit
MKLKPYPEYKDSGVEWLDDVPVEWCVKPLKFISDLRLSNIDKHTVEGEPPVLLCNYVDVYKNERIDSDIEFMSATASEEQIKRLTLSVGDVIITKDSEDPRDIGIPAYVAEICPDLVCGYHLALIRSNKDTSGEFLYYFLKSRYAAASFENEACGITRYAIGKYSIGNLDISVPLLEDQNTIARFLDRETSKLDTLVAKQEHLIELLLEKRQAIISHAVTKGLNPDAKMKDSGVEWLGMVPEHWKIKRLGYLTKKIGSGKTPSGGAETYTNEGILFIRSQNVYDDGLRLDDVVYISEQIDLDMKTSRVISGDILLNITGASIGRTCLVPNKFERANVNQHVCIIRLIEEKMSEYVSLVMKSNSIKSQIDFSQNGAGREGLNFPQIANLTLGVPTEKEQLEIMKYLKVQTSRIDTLIDKARCSIALAKEHRAALISAAVTGKIDVRKAA